MSAYANEQSLQSLPPQPPAGLKSDGVAIETEFVHAAHALGLDLTSGHLEQFRTYASRLMEWNQRVNLTAITDLRSIFFRHFLDSLTANLALPPPGSGGAVSCIDVGTGAGFPGLPLKLLRRDVEMTLLDSVGKKTAFLRDLTPALRLEGVEILTGRAEDLARSSAYRERFQFALSRAVAPLPALIEYLLPFCCAGGMAVAMKKGEVTGELTAARRACRALGGAEPSVIPVTGPGLEDGRLLVCVRKVSTTPDHYPRRPGVPLRNPL